MPVLDLTNQDATAYTVGYLISRTFDLLLGSTREDLNRLTDSIQASDTTIAFDFAPGRMNTGSYIAIDDEIMYVWTSSTSSGSTTAVVQRGMKNSAPAIHAAGTIVKVNPFFTQYQVRQTLQDEIRSWGPQVFQAKSLDIAATDFVNGYDLGELGNLYSVIDVQRSPDTIWATPPDEMWPSVKWRVVNSANTTSFPSGQALMIVDPVPVFDQPTFHVVYAAPIDVDSSFEDADSVIEMGMDSSDLDIAPYGAAWRLASSREIRRMLTEVQGNSADMQNFPPGYMVKTAEEFKQLRDSRLQDAIERLRAQYPIKRM